MQERENELERQYVVLRSCAESLKVEVLQLREELLKHAHCGSVPIQNHLSKYISIAMAQPNMAV